MTVGRADGGDDALAHPRHYGLLGGAAHQPVYVGTHRDSRFDLKLNPITGDRIDGGSGHGGRRHVDDLGVHRGADRFLDIPTRQIDGAGSIVGELDIGLTGRDQGLHHPLHIPAGKIVRLELVGRQIDARFFAMIRTRTITAGLTFLKRMKMIWSSATGAFESSDCHHSQKAFQMRAITASAMMPMMMEPIMLMDIALSSVSSNHYLSGLLGMGLASIDRGDEDDGAVDAFHHHLRLRF